MAKIQSFEDKVKKQAHRGGKKSIKMVYSVKSPKTGAWRFPGKYVLMPEGENEEQFYNKTVDELVKSFSK